MLYDIHAGGRRPIIGAYLAEGVEDDFQWVPCVWSTSGKHALKSNTPSNLDIDWERI